MAVVSVPEAPVNENDLSTRRKHQIGCSGKLADMEAVSVAESVNQAPHGILGFRILAANRLHDDASFSRGELVGHSERLIFLSDAPCLPE